MDAKTGKEAYASQRLPAAGIYYASPVAGDGKVYLASDSGIVIVVKAGPKYEVLAENELGEVIRARRPSSMAAFTCAPRNIFTPSASKAT